MSLYLHEVPGRLRIKVPDLKRNPQKARTLQRRLNGFAGVLSASVNSITGSLLVHYDPQISRSEAILSYVSRELDLHLAGDAVNEDRLDRAIGQVGTKVSKVLLMLGTGSCVAGLSVLHLDSVDLEPCCSAAASHGCVRSPARVAGCAILSAQRPLIKSALSVSSHGKFKSLRPK